MEPNGAVSIGTAGFVKKTEVPLVVPFGKNYEDDFLLMLIHLVSVINHENTRLTSWIGLAQCNFLDSKHQPTEMPSKLLRVW